MAESRPIRKYDALAAANAICGGALLWAGIIGYWKSGGALREASSPDEFGVGMVAAVVALLSIAASFIPLLLAYLCIRTKNRKMESRLNRSTPKDKLLIIASGVVISIAVVATLLLFTD